MLRLAMQLNEGLSALFALLGLCLVAIPRQLPAQDLRGRVLDVRSGAPLPGALVELRDSTGQPIRTAITGGSGGFLLAAPAPGRYLIRVAAIGYAPFRPTAFTVPAGGLVVPDISLSHVVVALPDLVVVARQRFCGKTGFSDEAFGSLLDNTRTALQVIEATIRSREVGFDVAIIKERTLYGSIFNFTTADTSVVPLAGWPVRSVPDDTLRRYGFARMLSPGDQGSWEYYGPDPEVLFSDWFLANHCFTLQKLKKGSDTLRVRFAPLKKSKQVDIRGELVLDGHDLSLHALTFGHVNLPGWMPEEAAGGEMEFLRLPSGLWVTTSWAIWAPILGLSRGGGGASMAGLGEARGYVVRVVVRKDSAGPGR